MNEAKNRIKQGAAAAVAALLLAASASAQDGENDGVGDGAHSDGAKKIYLAASVGKAKFKNACDGVLAGFACEDEDDAWKIALGWRGDTGLFSEIGYADLGASEWRVGGANSECRNGGAFDEDEVVSWAAKTFWMDGGAETALDIGAGVIAAFIKGGLGHWRADSDYVFCADGGGDVARFSGGDSFSGNSFHFGAGARYSFVFDGGLEIGAHAEWEQFRLSDLDGGEFEVSSFDEKIDLFSAGAHFVYPL